MAVTIDNDDMPDLLRGLRVLILTEEADAKKARAEGVSYAPQLENAVTHLKAKLAKYERAYEAAKQ
jgi:ribosomal protein L1